MTQSKTTSYQELNQELDAILTALQSGELDIDHALKQYERGMGIVKQLEVYLKQTQNKITKLKASFDS